MDDAIFWERIIDMPLWEAEQELVARREWIRAQQAETLVRQRLHEQQGNHLKARTEVLKRDALGVQSTMVNERIKYMRNLQNRLNWKDAVLAIYGQEGYEKCVVWMEQMYGEMDDRRREWKGQPPVRMHAV